MEMNRSRDPIKLNRLSYTFSLYATATNDNFKTSKVHLFLLGRNKALRSYLSVKYYCGTWDCLRVYKRVWMQWSNLASTEYHNQNITRNTIGILYYYKTHSDNNNGKLCNCIPSYTYESVFDLAKDLWELFRYFSVWKFISAPFSKFATVNSVL